MRKLLHIILLPFSIIYGTILSLRNKCYDLNIFHSVKFNTPIIVVGNLNVGGVGKTPHVEYLIQLLSPTKKIATLSRGYKRKTTGFVLGTKNSTITDIGDEPLQYVKKFKSITVAVDEKRVHGIEQLKKITSFDCIVLDDAFQHRAVDAGLNILITDFNNLYINDTVLPSGRLREWKSGMKRAQIIVVSKCSSDLSIEIMNTITQQIKPLSHQKVYFSAIKYGALTPINAVAKTHPVQLTDTALILSGIANPTPFVKEIQTQFKNTRHLNFKDHHQFNAADLTSIKKTFASLKGSNNIIITTEKDLMRLSSPEILTELTTIPLFYIPIEIYFLDNKTTRFNKQINEYVNP